MNPTLELSFWTRLLGILALEIICVVTLAFLAQSLTRSAFWRRTIWQISCVCALLLASAEITGVGRGFSMWLAGKPIPERIVSVRLVPTDEQFISLPMENEISEPVFIPQKEASIARSLWWPGIVWLTGFGLIVARILFARVLFGVLRWRNQKIKDTVLIERVSELANRLGIKCRIYLLESSGLTSPVAFGIFQPSIGLPSGFAQNFTVAQQNAMLTHELAHLAARDPFWYLLADCAAAIFWWHPAIWIARRRLHSASEHAADEAAVILENGPGTLAECLVNLGQQLTRTRSFGWLGVEGNGFRSHLGQRVERLLSLKKAETQTLRGRPLFFTKTALVILFGGLIIFTSGWIQNGESKREGNLSTTVQKSWNGSFASTAFAALAEEREKDSVQPSPQPEASPGEPTTQTRLKTKIAAATLVQDGKVFFESGKLEEAEAKLNEALKIEPENNGAFYYKTLIEKAKLAQPRPQSELTRPTVPPATLDKINIPLVRTNPAPREKVVYTSKGRQAIMTKLDRIRFSEAQFESVSLVEVLKVLRSESKKRDSDQVGVNFLFNPNSDFASVPTNDPIKPVDPNEIIINFSPALKDVRLADLLDAIIQVAEKPIQYKIEDYAVVFSPRKPEGIKLYTRVFTVDPKKFGQALARVSAESAGQIATETIQTNINVKVRSFFEAAGVDFGSPGTANGKAVFFKDRDGHLMVRATLDELEKIQNAIQPFVAAEPPQVLIEAKFIEIDESTLEKLGSNWLSQNTSFLFTNRTASTSEFISGNSAAGKVAGKNKSTNLKFETITGILTDSQYRAAVKTLETFAGTDTLSAPRLTTLSGRQSQISVLDMKEIVTGVTTNTNAKGDAEIIFKTESLPFGPVLDVIPSVSADGFTIHVTVAASVTEFLGYDDPGKVAVQIKSGSGRKPVTAPMPLPRTRLREATTTANVWDGQTIMLSGLRGTQVIKMKDKVPVLGDVPLLGRMFRSETSTTVKRNVMVFITPTLLDPAGNRMNVEEGLPSTTNSVPKQPERK